MANPAAAEDAWDSSTTDTSVYIYIFKKIYDNVYREKYYIIYGTICTNNPLFCSVCICDPFEQIQR